MSAAKIPSPASYTMKRVYCSAPAPPMESPARVRRKICDGAPPAPLGVRLPKKMPDASTLMRSRMPTGDVGSDMTAIT